MNAKEKKFVERLKKIEEKYNENEKLSGYEIEINYVYDDEPSLCGWYLYDYSEKNQEATINENFPNPLITEEQAEKDDIDVEECINELGYYYCGQ